MGINPFEPEEAIGTLWHRFIGAEAGAPHYPEAQVRFDELRARLGVFFRGLGGDPGTDIRPIGAQTSGHRLKLRQRLGHVGARLPRARFDGDTLFLPDRLDCYRERRLNADLYFWLTGWAAAAGPHVPRRFEDPLRNDLATIRHGHEVAMRALDRFPGLRPRYRQLCEAALKERPARPLPPLERALEEAISALLGGPPPSGEAAALHRAIADPRADFAQWTAPKRYHTFLPVPLWGVAAPRPARQSGGAERDEGSGGGENSGEERAYRARRRNADQIERKDSLLLHRFEAVLSFAEMINVNRDVDDEDEANGRRAREEMDEISLVDITRKAASRLKFHLDLAPADVETERLSGHCLYPEWDYRKAAFLPDHCRVLTHVAEAAPQGGEWRPDAAARRRIAAVRRQFEALRPKREIHHRQLDGGEFDTDALIRSRCDIRATGEGSDRIYTEARTTARDLAVAVLIDVSRSTESWIEGRQVIEVAREALAALSAGLAACGDDHAIHAFSSLRRDRVYLATVKDFDEAPGSAVLSRIGALRPGFYTRLGAAIRHMTGILDARPNSRRLLLVLTDGKPNDLDHYEGRYGVEDTAMAIREARRRGLAVFGVTIDARAQDYFPYIFGRNAYAIINHVGRLTQALPLLYRQLVS